MIQAIGSLALGMIFTANLVYQSTVVGLTPLQLVLVGTTLELVVFVFEIPTGIVADTYSRRLSVQIGYALIGLGFMLEGTIPTFAAVLLNQLIWGIGATFTSGAEQAWITDEIGEAAAGQIFLRGSQFSALGSFVGIVLSGLLGSVAVNIPIIAGGALMAAMSLFLFWRMPETGFKPTPQGDRNNWQQMRYTLRSGIRLVRTDTALRVVIGAGLVYGLFSEGFDRLHRQHILTNFDFPPLPIVGVVAPIVWFSILGAIAALMGIFVTEGLIRRVNTRDRAALARTLMWVSIPMIASLLAFGGATSFLMMVISFLVFNVTRGLSGSLFNAWSNHYFESSTRATMNSFMSQMNAIGQIVGGPPIGAFAEFLTPRFGIGIALRLTMGLCGLLLTPVLVFYRRAAHYVAPSTLPYVADLDQEA
jgi:DHA3 family tetracycline resistance protein-like MFS transporter